MCKFSDLTVGKKYPITINGSCGGCGSPTHFEMTTLYLGHISERGVTYDTFMGNNERCPGCGCIFRSHLDPCGPGNYYQLETIEAIGWPLEQEITNGSQH